MVLPCRGCAMMESGTTEAADRQAKLRATLAAFPGQGFAVLDGARFPDLPALCRRERLFARSLFLDHADVEVEKAGPWLVGLGQAPDATEKVLALVGDEPAAVYWCCEAGEAVLYRHLRALNMARIPRWAADGGTAPPTDGSGLEPVPVMFRHWDPRVLGALMPALDMAQFARVLGPAGEVAFLASDHGGVRRVVSDPAFPPAPGGMLTVRSDQIEALNARRLDASHRRIAAYLREVAPAETAGASAEALQAHVLASERSGRSLGIETEAGQARWAFVMVQTRGRVLDMPAVLSAIWRPGTSPDDNVRRFMDGAIASLRLRAGEGGDP